MKIKILFRSQWGFSLIEAMVALGVLSVGGYFLVSLLKTGAVGQKTMLAQDDARVLTDNMAGLLADPVACSNTFGGSDPTIGTAILSIKDKSNGPRFVAGQMYGNRGVTFNAATIGGSGTDTKTQIQLWSPGTTSGTGTALVRIDWRQTGTGDNVQGPGHLFRFFLVQVTSMTGTKIKSCAAQPGGGNLNYWSMNSNGDIYNNNASGSGSVGIGTPSPVTTLDVNGTARLHVNESSPFSCDIDHDGALALNKAHQLCVCNGISDRWVLPNDGTTTCSFPGTGCIPNGVACSSSTQCCTGLACNNGVCSVQTSQFTLQPLQCTSPGASTSPDCPSFGWADAYGTPCNQVGVKCRLSLARCAICH